MSALVWILLVLALAVPFWLIYGPGEPWAGAPATSSPDPAVLARSPEVFRPLLAPLLAHAVHSPDRLDAAALALLLSENRFELDGRRPEVAGSTPCCDFGPLALEDAIELVSDVYRFARDGVAAELGDALERGSHAAAWPVAARFPGLRSRLVAHPWVLGFERCT